MTGYKRVLLKLSGEVFGGGSIGVDLRVNQGDDFVHDFGGFGGMACLVKKQGGQIGEGDILQRDIRNVREIDGDELRTRGGRG